MRDHWKSQWSTTPSFFQLFLNESGGACAPRAHPQDPQCVLLAVTAILTVPNVFLLDTTESLRNKLLKESQLQWLEDDIHKSRNSYGSVNSKLFCTHLVVAHCLCHQCHSTVQMFLKPHRVRTLRLDLCLLSLTMINTSCKFVVKVLHIYSVYIWCSYPNWQIKKVVNYLSLH